MARCREMAMVRWQHANCELQGGQRTNRVVVKLALNALINYWDVRCAGIEPKFVVADCCWSCWSELPHPDCWLLAVVCGAFNAFRIYLWPLEARNSATPIPPAVPCSATSSVRPFHRKAKEYEMLNAKMLACPQIFIGHLSQIFHTFTKGQNLTLFLSRFCEVVFMNGLCWPGIGTGIRVFSRSQGTRKILRLQFLYWGECVLSGDLNKMQFG